MPLSETFSPSSLDHATSHPRFAAPRVHAGRHAAGRTPRQSLTLKVYQSLHELEPLRPLWGDLVAQYPFASIFCTWEWLTSWWKSFGTGRELLILALFDSPSRLIGVAPLSISSEPFLSSVPLRVLRLMGDGSGDSDNLDLPVRPGFEKIFARRVLEYLQNRKDQWDIAQLNTMPVESLVARCFADALKPPHWSCFEYSRTRSTVFLPETWDEYLDQLSPKNRKNFAYYARRLQKLYSVRIYRCLSESELPLCLDSLFRLHQLHWQRAGEPGSFSSPARRDFYADLSLQLLAKNRLELWMAEVDGKIAAAQFCMRHGNQVYALQEGYDPARTADSIGYVLRGEVRKQLIREGIRVYDFLGGEDHHKSRWKAQLGFYRDLHFARALDKGGILLGCVHHMGRSKEWLRARLQPSTWEVLHRINMALPRRRALKPSEAA
jgi:CelD/BcsL family acetyltransferase involved in cellulose biosynthesis